MAEVLFYHLQQQPLESVLPTLLQKTLERGWRAVIQVTTEERLSALDDHLWTFSDESFLPHGTDREAHAADQPILITLGADNPNGSAIRFLAEGADLPQDIASYQRLAILFDGNDVPWAHLDIAGTAMGSPATEINKGWSSGWGVRLLDRLVRDHYES